MLHCSEPFVLGSWADGFGVFSVGISWGIIQHIVAFIVQYEKGYSLNGQVKRKVVAVAEN